MRTEPAIDRAVLLNELQGTYRLAVTSLQFRPLGLSGAALYEVTTPDAAYFLKVWPPISSSPARLQMHERLEFTRLLARRAQTFRVPAPLLTNCDDVWAAVDGIHMALTPLLPGEPLTHWTPGLLADLGRALAVVHRAPYPASQPPRTALDVPFEAALRSSLAAAQQLPGDARSALLQRRAWAQREAEAVEAQLTRLHDLGAVVAQIHTPWLLAHTDLHTGNLLVDTDGTLSLLDWDEVKLAPPEHDLWLGLGADGLPPAGRAGVAALLNAYRDAGGSDTLHPEHLAFYLLRRHLEDAWIGLGHVLAPDDDPTADAQTLEYLETGMRGWQTLDVAVETFAAAL